MSRALHFPFLTLLCLVATLSQGKTIQIQSCAVGVELKAGDTIYLPDGGEYEVVRECAAGPDRRVFQVRSPSGQEFVFKHARSASIPKGRAGMEKERNTVRDLETLGVDHPKIIAFGEDWLLRDRSPGELGVEWFRKWKARGYPADDLAWKAFLKLVRRTANRGKVVGAMDLDDLILQGTHHWIVIDSGRVRTMSVEEAWDYYVDDLRYSWVDKIGEHEFCPYLLKYLAAERSKDR